MTTPTDGAIASPANCQESLDDRRVVWVTRSFLDYRIPVFAEMKRRLGDRFLLIFSKEYVPERSVRKAMAVLGDQALGLEGEWRLGGEDRHALANRNLSLRYHPKLPGLIRRHRPDVMVGDGFFKWTGGALIHKIRTGTPLVICYERTFHTERNAQGLRVAYRRWVIKMADAMCCNGKLCREYTEWLGMPGDRITTGHMAADTVGISAAADLVTAERREEIRRELAVDGLMFIFVGRIIPGKGIMEMLAGWKLFQESGGSGSLVFVGEGDQRAACEERVKELGLIGVRFTGAKDYDVLAPYYSAADCFVIPTLEDNWSLVVPEAMACGLPVLCSTFNGCWPELVQDGRNGWTFDPHQPEDIARVLRLVSDNRSRLGEMGAASREIVAGHGPSHAVDGILGACRVAIARRGRARS